MSLKLKWGNILKLLFPSSYIELIVFLFFVISYGIFGSYIAINYTIIFDDRIPWDAYFSFDNRSIVMTGGSFERHPLSYYFFNWIIEFGLFFSDGKKDVNFRLFLAWMSNLSVSFSLLQVFKYLKNIIGLPLKISLLILLFFCLFSTNIILSFTPENFTYTLLLLTLYNNYSAAKLQKGEKISILPITLAGITIGGLTITNIIKVFIPIIFEKHLFKSWKNFVNAFLRVSAACIVFILLYLNRIHFKYETIFNKTNEQYEKFSNVRSIPTWDMIVSFFFGENILFSNFIIRDKHNMKGFHFKGLIMDVYTSWVPYIFVLVLLILVLWSYIKNFRNKWVQVLMLSFLVDIAIHCVMKFGLHTGYIYGAHFVFVYPLLIGWLFYAYRFSPKILTLIATVMGLLFIYLALNNVIRMNEFISFLDTYYA